MAAATFATSMLAAGFKAGLISSTRIKKDGSLKNYSRTGIYWPRLRRGQPSFTKREVR